jgi:CheY-like chemotaxis protein
VILLDAHMPGVDGVGVLERLTRAGSLNRDTPVYVVTADTSQGLREQVMARGAACLVTKPVEIATLVAFIKTTLKTGEARAKLS